MNKISIESRRIQPSPTIHPTTETMSASASQMDYVLPNELVDGMIAVIAQAAKKQPSASRTCCCVDFIPAPSLAWR